ncbi:MAG: L-lactate dehydrogenase [Pseudomonadota bacterium]
MSTPVLPSSLPAYAQRAREVLPQDAWTYFHSGAADEITAQRNVQAWQDIALQPRALQDLRGGHTHTQLLGKTWPCPLIVAPMAYQAWAHPDGERAMALAAGALGCGFTLSQHSTTALQDIAPLVLADAGRGPLWMQLANGCDRAWLRDVASQAHAAGYEALVLSVDAPVQGSRDRLREQGVQIPAHLCTPHWRNATPTNQGLCQGHVEHALRWDDVTWLQQHVNLPVLLKGITHPLDAQQAARLNIHGLIVSNHGGRVLDTQASTAASLPGIADAVQGDLTLLVDGGIRRGSDMFKALALGAHAVLVGQLCLNGLAVGGAQGVAHVLRLLRDEFEMTMALCGCPNLAAITRAHVNAPYTSCLP